MTNTKKTLYFEGAGWSKANISIATIGNCRIRTAFHTDDGKRIYLEVIACERGKHSSPLCAWEYTGFVDSCHYITDDKPNDDENKHQIHFRNERVFEYTEQSILNFVNKLGASFEAIKVVPDLGGYNVFGDHSTYNYGDLFRFNEALTERREKAHEYYYQLEKSEGKEYPNFSMWVDKDDETKLHLLRHFNGYNKHYLIDVSEDCADWKNAAQETKLGRYGC